MNPLGERFSQFGDALSKCSELLVELVSLGGDEAYFDKTPPQFNTLSNLDIVLGNVSDGYSASTLLMDLSRALARQETTKRLAPDVDEWLAQVDLRINLLNNALAESNNDGYITRISEIRELVLIMREGLTNEMRNIEFAINTKFGNVESIHDKQAENKYLIARVSRLTDKLMILDYKKLMSLSVGNTDLLTLLPNKLHNTIEDCRLSLINSLPRLKHLLWEFEKISKNTKLVWALHHHLRNQSIAYTHIPSDSELDSLQISSQYNVDDFEVYPSICDDQFSDDIIDIVHEMKARPITITLPVEEEFVETEFTENDDDVEATLDTFMENKLLEMVLLSKKQKVSCRTFWKENISTQKHSAGFMQWAHKNLERSPQLEINTITQKASNWSANEVIVDFTVELKRAN